MTILSTLRFCATVSSSESQRKVSARVKERQLGPTRLHSREMYRPHLNQMVKVNTTNDRTSRNHGFPAWGAEGLTMGEPPNT